MVPSVSIILCTRNRSLSLLRTLDSLARCGIPPLWDVEIVVVDNGSTDDTEKAVRSCRLKGADLRYRYEPRPGLSNARNTGLSQASGEIIIFTDDDVTVPEQWIQKMAAPILTGSCDALTGRVILPAYLHRPWMTPMHRAWLSCSQDAQIPGYPISLVGASMGFHRAVLTDVPAFDPELGAGALGMSEDTLFGLQLIEAGYRIHLNADACAVHHFDPARLQRRNWLSYASKRGKSEGYLFYHWEHGKIRDSRPEFLSYYTRLKLRRLLHRPPSLQSEGCPVWEMSYVANLARLSQIRKESLRKKIYEFRALRRIDCVAQRETAPVH